MARTTARWAGLLGVARALRAANRPGGPGLGEQLSAVPRMVGASVQGRYDGLSRGRLAMIVMLLLYVISPIDFLPEGFLLVFGLVDDAAIAAVIAGWLLGEADNYLTWERRGMFVVPGKTLPGETLYRGV
ncbi:MAG TPA: YkvA family protein [Acidothermales bacterium]|jgi:uncharacterized membrane protein YkvA (DUF1232 family)|nr:YkvA family protein [Actinomycetes bacterium]